MNAPSRADQTFQIIMRKFLETGQAPHFTEIASKLGVRPDDGRQALHDLFSVPMFPGWLFPNTDYVTSFPPFNNLPTQYRVSIDGQQQWFAQ